MTNIKKKKKKKVFFFFFFGISRIPFQVGNSANSATFPRSRKITGPTTYQVDTRVRKCASQVGDNELLARLSMDDMVALEAKYHSKCLLALYYRAKTTVEAEPKTDHSGMKTSNALQLYLTEVDCT